MFRVFFLFLLALLQIVIFLYNSPQNYQDKHIFSLAHIRELRVKKLSYRYDSNKHNCVYTYIIFLQNSKAHIVEIQLFLKNLLFYYTLRENHLL